MQVASGLPHADRLHQTCRPVNEQICTAETGTTLVCATDPLVVITNDIVNPPRLRLGRTHPHHGSFHGRQQASTGCNCRGVKRAVGDASEARPPASSSPASRGAFALQWAGPAPHNLDCTRCSWFRESTPVRSPASCGRAALGYQSGCPVHRSALRAIAGGQAAIGVGYVRSASQIPRRAS